MNEYQAMNNDTVTAYLHQTGLFPADHALTAQEIGDGNLNLVFRVADEVTGQTVIVKQALPYLRVAGEGWKLTLDRNRIEAEAMQVQNKVCPGAVPAVLHHSDTYALTVMEDLGDMQTLRKGLMNRQQYPHFPAQIGRFFARNLFFTSDFGMGAQEKKKLVAKFINPELCDITEKLVLHDPYTNAPSNDINPEIAADVAKLWANPAVHRETAILKHIFMTKAEALLHGDVHTGSIFIDTERAIVFDTEFAFYGPYGYDIGLLLANFILNYISWEGRPDTAAADIAAHRAYLLSAMENIWAAFCQEFSKLWQEESQDVITAVPGYYDAYLKTLLAETIGFATCEVLRRIIGMAHVPDLDSIENLQLRARAQRLGLCIGEALLLQRHELSTLQAVTALMRRCTAEEVSA